MFFENIKYGKNAVKYYLKKEKGDGYMQQQPGEKGIARQKILFRIPDGMNYLAALQIIDAFMPRSQVITTKDVCIKNITDCPCLKKIACYYDCVYELSEGQPKLIPQKKLLGL